MSADAPFGVRADPASRYERIVLGHGSGGSLSADLRDQVLVPALRSHSAATPHDQAMVAHGGGPLAFATESFVVQPIFFPGGDIGRLAVHGTANALAVAGATPRFLSAAFILEEGLFLHDLSRVLESMRRASDEAGVAIVASETKIVERGKGDAIFLTMTGIGDVPRGRRPLSLAAGKPGDRVLVSGTIGDHAVAILSVREGLDVETEIESDCAPLAGLVRAVLLAAPGTRVLRDPTRGGLAATLNALAESSQVGVHIDESKIPHHPSVRAACEILGLDSVCLANAGKLVAVVPPEETETALRAMRGHPLGLDAAVIGELTERHPGLVVLRSVAGGERGVPLPAGQLSPRLR